MSIKFNMNSSNDEYNNLLKDLGIINTTSNNKKELRKFYNYKKSVYRKYLMIT